MAEYITFNTDLRSNEEQSSLADKDRDNLIYYKLKKQFLRTLERVSIACWICCFVSDATYYFLLSNQSEDFELSHCHLVLAFTNFLVPTLIRISEAWSNSLLHRLFDILQVSDYNKMYNSQINRTTTGDNLSLDSKKIKTKLLVEEKTKKVSFKKTHTRSKWLCCFRT